MKKDELTRARSVPAPTSSSISASFAGADLVDAYAIGLPADSAYDIGTLSSAVLGEPAPWFHLLIGLRDSMVSIFGIKTTRQLRGKPGYINFFRIESVAENELVVAENDKHLDFRASLMKQRSATKSGEDLIITTGNYGLADTAAVVMMTDK